MTNTKSRKGSAKSTLTNETVVASMDELDGAGRNWFRHGNNDMLSENTDVDDEEYINDSDTGTSFSLEECMNEFRARRNRRISLHSRQEADRGRDEHKSHDVTETDLINQNLCNKEQERKCKPCKNGFCYCFTSDSGDGAGSVGGLTACGYTRASNIRQSRRHRRSDFFQADEKANDYRTVAAEERSSKSLPNTPRTQRNGKTNSEAFGKNQLTAISRLENSHDDAPLIHIIQELRDNCVISEVRVNKEKLKANHLSHYQQAKSGTEKKVQINHQKIDSTTKPHNVQQSSAKIIPVQRQEPTAPSWESIAETGTPQSDCLLSSPLENCSSKHIGQAKCRNVAGGRLLQKRLSSFNFSYKPAYKKEPPPKPPRSSHSFEENLSTSTNTTSLSVREAERVLDEYLAEKGYTIPTISKRKSQGTKSKPWSNTESPSETYIKKDILITRKGSGDTKTTYPSLKDIERVIDSKKPSQYERNIRKLSEGEPKVYRIGWNEPRINYMLNYDSKRSRKEFQTSSTKAQPQQSAGAYVLPEEGVGWKIPPNVDLDMVDGEVHHNLATNVENKDTPVKSKTIGPKSSATSKKQRVIWSEQLRNLSPWSNKQKLPCEIKSSLRSSSKSFLKSSKIKILRLVSPKKENKERFNFQIRKTPHRHVAIQTSRENLSHHQYSQSPPGSYHSPVQSTNLQSSHFAQSHITTVTGDKPDEQHFDFARHIHSPSKKAIRPSQRKLYFPLNCAESCSSPPLTEIETYRSFNEELDQHLSLSKMSYILTNIRAKLEANDDLAVQTFQVSYNM